MPETPTNERPPLYAVVVVRTELRRRVTGAVQEVDSEDEDHLTRAFHYSVPDGLRDDITPGQLVWVPFGARFLQGIVVGLDDTSPVQETRDIDQIVERQPVLSQTHLELARWISETYLAPIHLVLDAMLPPGVTQEVDIVVERRLEVEPESLTDAQAALLDLLRDGPLTYRQISRRKIRNWRAVVNQIVDKGWAAKTPRVRAPSVRPKRVTVVRLAAETQPEDWPSNRSPRQRAAIEYLAARDDGEWLPLGDAARDAQVSPSVFRALARKGLADLDNRQVWRDPLEDQTFVPVIPPPLTPEQATVWQAVRQDIQSTGGRSFLLEGVTGSGKTEIYLRAVRHALDQGRGAIALVPEIALTPQTIRRFGARFPSTLAVMHSRLSPGERYDQWRRIRSGELRVVVGSRSAIFSPVRNLGLIILDEEHEWSYKQTKMPRYHARDVAVHLAHIVGATLILGSATPSLESAHRAERGEFIRLTMPRRIMGHRRAVQEQAQRLDTVQVRYRSDPGSESDTLYAELPPVSIVDMRQELRAGNRSIFCRDLQRAIEVALAMEQQVILFLNRRGAATFVMCRDCGYVAKCRRCDVPYTYHSSGEALVCHHCNARAEVPIECPECGSHRIKFFGAGTQRVEEAVRSRFPDARLVRWDLDTTGGKMSHERILDRFIRGEADVMIGTQMIAKGLDLPKVTLVGVISADTILHLPDFRSGERTFQLLTQVAGRAGRSVLGGRVIIQTYTPLHPAIQAASKHDYTAFYEREIAFRREYWYPPLSRLVKLVYVHASANKAQDEAERLHKLLRLRIARLGLPDVDLIGPAPAFFGRVRGKYRWQILIRGADPAALIRDLRLPLGWRIDVDPVSTL